MKKNLEIYSIDITSEQPLPFADEGIRAGFPSPAQDYMEQVIDLKNPLTDYIHNTKHRMPAILSKEDEV